MRYRLALGFAAVLAACSGGGSSSTPSVPTLPWGSFRHDASNTAVGGLLNQNQGLVTLLVAQADLPKVNNVPVQLTSSTPAIDRNNNLVLGTSNGVISVGPDGGMRWVFDGFETATPSRGARTGCAVCDTPGVGSCMSVGRVSASPTITAGGAIVFGTEAGDGRPGALFVIQQNGDSVQCVWYFQPSDDSTKGIRSSAVALVDPLDLSLLTVYVGADDGVLYSLNSDGSVRWSFLTGADPITSTPALDSSSNVYVTAPNGVLSVINFNGSSPGIPPVQVSLGKPPTDPTEQFQPSPGIGVGPTAFAIGSGSALFAVNPFGQPQQKWQFAARHCSGTISQACTVTADCPAGETCALNTISGSFSFIAQNFSFMASSLNDTIIYAVDQQGTAYAVRNQTGEILPSQRCSTDVNLDCRTDSCNPTGAQPPVDTCIASTHRCTVSGQQCTQDSCVVNNNGICVVTDGIVPIAGAPVSISGSPVVSDDPFIVIGTPPVASTRAAVCARSLANLVPGQSFSSPPATWRGGHCSGTTTETCVIDKDCPSDETCAGPDCQNHMCASPGGHCSVTTSQTCVADKNCPLFPDERCVVAGSHCSVTTSQSCAFETDCPNGEICAYVGCIPLTDSDGNLDPGPVLSSPLIGENSTIYVTTNQGLYVIK